MKTKLIKRTVALGAAATMMLAMGATAFAADTEETAPTAQFYAHYDINDDGVIADDEWTVAPYNMNVGNILGTTVDGDTATVTMGVGTYSIAMGPLGVVDLTGYISALTPTEDVPDNGITVTSYDTSYSPDMITEVEVDLTKAVTITDVNGNTVTGNAALLTAKKNIGKLGMTPPGNMGTEMEVCLVISQ